MIFFLFSENNTMRRVPILNFGNMSWGCVAHSGVLVHGASQYNVVQVMPVNSYKSCVAGVWPHLPGVTNGCPLIYLCQAP